MDLGANDTALFDIDNLTLANAQATYDSLMNYDVFFIKGGNQWDYYNTWKGSKVEDAITDKFNQGGVIMGTSAGTAILSEYIFTAENGSVYPDEGLANYNNPNITIENDFLNIFPNYIFDTHFVERGRLGRLLAFVKNIQLMNVHGLGVDDRTAICINNNNIGTVMGSAGITIVEGFVTLNKKCFQLIDGQQFPSHKYK
jgi:cyanophycinase